MKLLPIDLLRSVIRFADEEEIHLASNLQSIRAEVETIGVDKLIIDFIADLYDKTQEIPTRQLVGLHFESDAAVAARLDLLNPRSVDDLLDETKSNVGALPIAFLSGSSFRYALDSFKATMAKEATGEMLLEASAILTNGIRGRNGSVIIGPDAAIEHLVSRINILNTTLKRSAIEGSFRHDATKVRKQYVHWKNNQADTVGVLTGIDRIDAAHRGAMKGDLVLVLGFVSHLKTSFCLNWLYNAAVLFGRNTGIVSLETQVSTLRMLLYVMHSGHIKFKDAGFQALDHDKVVTGSLTPEEEEFFNVVIDDFENCKEYGEIFYKEPNESTTIQEIQRWAESKNRVSPLDLLVVDYLGLVDPEKGHSSMDSSANLNKVIRQAKTMAMAFDQSRGIPVVSPHQANRQGLLEAQKNGGKYQITALANSNEAERSSDLVYYTYLDDILRNSRELIMGNLKARNVAKIQETFKVFADPATRIISNLDLSGGPADLVQI